MEQGNSPKIRILVKGARFRGADWNELASQCDYDCRRLAMRFNITPRQLARIFAREIGVSPQRWLDAQRVLAAEQLLTGADSVKAVGLSLGFRYPANFHRHFKKHFGMGPAQFLEMKRARTSF